MDYKVTDTELTSIANAIRAKGGTSAQLTFPNDFVTAIGNIPSGSGGGDYYRLRYYTASGSVLLKTEYILANSHSSQSGDWSISPNGDTPIDLNTISTSTDLYMIVPDNYYSSNDDTLGVLVFENYNVWFFNGYTKNTTEDVSLPSELSQYTLPSLITQAKAYRQVESYDWIANVGFYNGMIRSWTTNNIEATVLDSVFAVVEAPVQSGTPTQNIAGANCQMTEYQTPLEYIASHTIE